MAKTGRGDPVVGERMRAAAREKRLTVGFIAEQMGAKSPSTIYRWWTGKSEPSAGDLHAYCKIVGKDMSEMYGEPVPERLLSLFLAASDRLMAGQPFGRALAQELAPDQISEAERRELDALSSDFRRLLRLYGGKEWDLLTDSEKLQILLETKRIGRGADPE